MICLAIYYCTIVVVFVVNCLYFTNFYIQRFILFSNKFEFFFISLDFRWITAICWNSLLAITLMHSSSHWPLPWLGLGLGSRRCPQTRMDSAFSCKHIWKITFRISTNLLSLFSCYCLYNFCVCKCFIATVIGFENRAHLLITLRGCCISPFRSRQFGVSILVE